MRNSLGYNYKVLDLVLDMFDSSTNGIIAAEDLYRGKSSFPSDQNKVLSFLEAEGLLEQVPDGFKITYKGRMIIHQGGFWKIHRRQLFGRICTIAAAIAGVFAVILQILFHIF